MRTSLVFSLALVAVAAEAQLNMSQLGHIDYQALHHNTHLSNIWGYTDEFGNEYALVGVNGIPMAFPPSPGGLSVVDVTDPANPVEVAFIQSAISDWREIKTRGDYAYITTEAQAGLLIVDLSPLPQSTTLPSTVFNGNGWTSSHSLFIDEAAGRLYLHGSNRGNGGVIIYDLTQDPMAPVEIGEFDPWYCHDSFARGDTLYAAHIYNGIFSIVDVSDPANPVLLGTQSTPSNFTHNVWLDDSGDHLFTTDEVSDAYVGSYDVSDPSDIQFLDKLQSDPGSGTIPHNTYWLNDLLVTSYYTFGVVVYDATQPDDLVEVGNIDTSPLSGNGFNGVWGVYPFFPSGNLVASDIEGGLFVLGVNYTHACWLRGTVTDANTSAPVAGATVTVVSTPLEEQTNAGGDYATGYHTPGGYDVLFSAPAYEPLLITNVQLSTNTTTIQDAQLTPLVPFSFNGSVVDSGTSTGVPNAQVRLTSGTYTWDITCDANGDFTIPAMYEDQYDFVAAQWGWETTCGVAGLLDAGSPPLQIMIPAGYSDDFAVDLGWTVDGDAIEGIWERAEPVGQIFPGFELQTEEDLQNDCLDHCYLTGNGPDPGLDDVQDGTTRLVSPVFDATLYTDPYVQWSFWYFDFSLNGAVDDSMIFYLRSAGVDHLVDVVNQNDNSVSTWTQRGVRVSDIIAPAADMQLVVTASKLVDIGNHIMECALDGFSVIENPDDGLEEMGSAGNLMLWPNPNDGHFQLVDSRGGRAIIEVLDVQGRVIMRSHTTQGVFAFSETLEAGAYVVKVIGDDGSVDAIRMMVR